MSCMFCDGTWAERLAERFDESRKEFVAKWRELVAQERYDAQDPSRIHDDPWSY